MLGRRELTGEEASYEASLYPWYSLWILKAGAFDLIPNNPKLGRIHGLSPAAILLQPYMAWSLIIPSGAEQSWIEWGVSARETIPREESNGWRYVHDEEKRPEPTPREVWDVDLPLVLHESLCARTTAMVNDITREWWRDELSRNWTNGRLQMWLSEIVQFHQTENDSNGSNDWTSNMTRIVRRHLEQILTVQHWAEIMETNVNTLRQRCKKETGQSALKFLETIKLDTARILLRTTDHPIEFIAIRSGFSSRSVFTRWFRNKEGCSPRTWREEISLTR